MRLHSLHSADESKMANWPRGDYLKKAKEQGADIETARIAWHQAKAVQDANLPAVLSLKHLAQLTGCSYESLRALSSRGIDSPYRVFQIKKRIGGFRRICIPKPDLLRVQQWIDCCILSRVAVHINAKAYSKGSSTVDCARVHAGCEWLIKCDVQQFFESISEIQVFRTFSEMGYEPLIAFQMARLCTRTVVSRRRYKLERWRSEGRRKYSLFANEKIGHLPQGAPTSPKLSNLVMLKFDERITRRATDAGLSYTRYADDLMFSAFENFSRENASSFIGLVYQEMRRIGLRPHTTKTKVIPPGARKIVLGLCVNDDVVRLTKEFKRELKTNVHFICRFSLQRQAEFNGFDSVIGFRNHIAGKLRYAWQVEPLFVERLEARLNKSPDWTPVLP